MQSIQIAIVDPDELSRHGLQNMILEDRRWRPMSLFGDVGTFETSLQTHTVNIVLLDDTLPRVSEPRSLVDRWQMASPGLIVVMLSQRLSSLYIQQLFTYGVMGFIHRRDCTKNTVLACLETVSRLQHYISPQASAELYRRDTQAATLGLRRTDIDVLHGLFEGLTTQEIALRIGLDERSIYRSRYRLRTVLGARTSEQIIALAIKNGLLDLKP
ncbi:MAG TPA: hypothetical protein VHL11_04295 [Phototrophicaceae bacterium]|jgi:DNA-binding NarL/FixJ family response regulator|nr:hypothetical protein [Phototrophicaceae bacterium]